MRKCFPATHSTLSAAALANMATQDYELGSCLRCQLLHRGLNDTYLLTADGSTQYVVRVYRTGWRSVSEISYELEVLQHLQQKSVHVSVPLLARDKELVHPVMTVEGIRYVVVFTFAPGREPEYEDGKQATQYGRAAAQVHTATDGFASEHSRFVIDIDHLLRTPMEAVRPILSRRIEDWRYLEGLADRLRSRLEGLPLGNLDRGFCHGDLNGGNASFEEDGTVTLYDFDCGGFGWRAYDIAVFRWCARLHQKEKELWGSFLQGYREIRELKQPDVEAVPLFIGARHIWILGLHAANAYDLGYGWLNDSYYDHQMKFFHEWDNEFLLTRAG